MKKINVYIEFSGDNFGAASADINGVVIATGSTLEEVKLNFTEALDFHIQGALEDGDELPAYIISKEFELYYKLEASAILHLADGLVTRSALSRVTGINQKQLSHYLTGHRKARPEQIEKISNGIKILSSQLNDLTAAFV